MRDAKARKFKTLRKESDKAKINLLRLFCLVCVRILFGAIEKA
jgi:hypothetical protein